ncbi:MAG: hypothetical protein U0Q47_06025 [Mycobacterium sp.]
MSDGGQFAPALVDEVVVVSVPEVVVVVSEVVDDVVGGTISAALSVGEDVVVSVVVVVVVVVAVVVVVVVVGRGRDVDVAGGTGTIGGAGCWRELCEVWITAKTRITSSSTAAAPEA